jgi:hypothetical protein
VRRVPAIPSGSFSSVTVCTAKPYPRKRFSVNQNVSCNGAPLGQSLKSRLAIHLAKTCKTLVKGREYADKEKKF